MKMQLFKWGYDEFEETDTIFVIKGSEVEIKALAKNIIRIIDASNADSPKEFFDKHKFCFLATPENFQKFIVSVETLLKTPPEKIKN
jgi:hypothetical protein